MAGKLHLIRDLGYGTIYLLTTHATTAQAVYVSPGAGHRIVPKTLVE
jgi:hypothetical protein